MLCRPILVLLVALTISPLASAQNSKVAAPTEKTAAPTGKAAAPTEKTAAPTGKAAAPTGMEKFTPSQVISVDNAVAFPVDI